MQNSGANVKINVTKNAISLRSIETGEMIVNHDLPRISFASGGDQVNSTLNLSVSNTTVLILRIPSISWLISRKT